MKRSTKTVLAISRVHTMMSGVALIEQYPEAMNVRLFYTDGTTETAIFDKDISTVENVFEIISAVQRDARLLHNMNISTKD